MGYLLDTSIVSNPVSRTPDPQLLERFDAVGPECVIAAPVWHELMFGVRRLPRGRRRVVLEAYIQDVVRESFPILPYDEQAADWHARERARLEGLGRPSPFVDGQIAAIAQVNNLVLVTVNISDFERFRGLRIENWLSKKQRS